MKTKIFLKTLMVLLFTVLPGIASAQGDLALFDLKGKVKQCTWVNHKAGCLQKGFSKTANKEVITFSQAGHCQKWNDILFAAQGRSGNALHNEIKRDAKGRTVYGSLYNGFYAPGSGEETFGYDAKGKLAKFTYEDAGAMVETTFEYDAEGKMSSSISSIEDMMEDNTSKITVTYQVQNTDDKGNWTKRLAKPSAGASWVEFRTIVYYQ